MATTFDHGQWNRVIEKPMVDSLIFSDVLLTATGGRFDSETRTCLPQVRVYVSTSTMTSPSTDCWRAPTISNPGQIKAKCAQQEWSSHATVNRESLKNAYDPMSQYPQLCKHFKSHFSGDIESWRSEFLMDSFFIPYFITGSDLIKPSLLVKKFTTFKKIN